VSNNLFYPELQRSVYSKKNNGSNYAYGHYYEEIAKDSKNRCVYCDAKVQELGGDNFQLDHFRPKEQFPDLKNEPNNLVLSCPKCNRLKSSHWPIDVSEDNRSHDRAIGFIEPFIESSADYYQIDSNGEISAKKGPANYQIKLLKLDRISRTLLRKRRILREELKTENESIHAKLIQVKNKLEEPGSISSSEKEVLGIEMSMIIELFVKQKRIIGILEG